jgi:hypothetical protein
LLISLDPASAHLRDPETWYLGYDGDELLRPGKYQAVLVVAAADLAAVGACLRPQLGTSLCVVPSRWT